MNTFIQLTFNYACSCLVSTFVIYKMSLALFQPKYSYKSIYVIALMIFFALWVSLNYLSLPILNTLYSLFGVFLFDYLLFKAPISKMIFYDVLLFFYMIIIEGVSNLIFYQIFDIQRVGLFTILPTIFSQLIVLNTYKIFILFCQKNALEKKYFKECLFLMLLLFFEIYILYTFQKFTFSKDVGISLIIFLIGFLSLDFYLLYLFDSVEKRHIYENKSVLLKQQAEMMNTYYENIEKKYNQSQKIVHDVRNHMQTLENLTNQNIGTISKEYSEQLYGRLNKLGLQFRCEDPILTIIINDKMFLCDEKKIDFNIKILECHLLYIEEFERTTLFSNLLDNAIEACDAVEKHKRAIEIRMHRYNDYQIIKIWNPYNGHLQTKDKLFKSTKNKHLGIGLTNVQEVVEKYNGDISFETDKQCFIVKIIFPIQRNKEVDKLRK